jgi:hypothetical protein
MKAADSPKGRHPRLRARLGAVKRWWSTPAAAFPPVVPNSVPDYPFRRMAGPHRCPGSPQQLPIQVAGAGGQSVHLRLDTQGHEPRTARS